MSTASPRDELSRHMRHVDEFLSALTAKPKTKPAKKRQRASKRIQKERL